MSFQPEFFGKYILLEKLATGGMAEVYLAKLIGAENVSKYVAIKRILPQFSQNQEFIEMFKEEAKIATNLSHSAIVPIYEFGEQNGQFYLVMEYVEGRNLRQVLNRLGKTNLRLSLDQIVYIVNEVARGLDYAHRCVDSTTGRPLSITHRDMSPQNVMVSFEGEVKIVDFGIAKAESKIENTRAGTLKGKFGYMSPEQAEGQEVDFRTDIFSLGIVLWELIAGERLFISNNEVNTLRKIRDCIVPSLRKLDPNIPAEIERIANKALARDRNLRYQSAGDFHRDLSKFLNRQFPDFTSQDFSTFVKTIFEKEREESRGKMIEYARVQAASVSDKTQYIGDVTHTITETASNKQKEDSLLQNLLPEHRTKSADSIQLDVKNRRQDLLRQADPYKPHGLGEASGITHTGTSRSNMPFGSGTSYTVSQNDGGSDVFLKVIGLAAVLGGLGYALWTYKPELIESFLNQQTASSALSDSASTSLSSQGETQKATALSPSQYKVLITSTPSDAEIIIDGQKTGTLTPAQIELPANKNVKISLVRRGYAPFEAETKVTQEGQEVRGNLSKRREAYLSVNAKPGAPYIYVNGKLESRDGRLKDFVVTPDTEILVQAYDPTTKFHDHVRIKLKEQTTKEVQLFLSKNSSSPTTNPKRSTSSTGSRRK